MMDNNKINESNEEFMDDYYKMMQQYLLKMQNNPTPNIKNEIDAEGGKIITPVPFCCFKTTDSSNQKIFINLTSHELVDAPKEENILELNNQYGVRIPLSLSEKFEDFDNKMGICQVYDIIIAKKMIEKCEKEPLVLGFIYQLICNRIKEKYNHQISENYKRLKNVKYKGNKVRDQRIRVRKGPKIEEVMESSSNTNKLNANVKISQDANQSINEQGKTPDWNFFILKKKVKYTRIAKDKELSIKDINLLLVNSKELINNKHSENVNNCIELFDGYNCSPKYGYGFIIILALPLISKSFGISMNISDEGFVFSCGKIYQLKLSFPFRINSRESESIFDNFTRNLLIILPFYNEDIQIQLKTNQEEVLNSKKIVISSPNLTDNYLFDVV